MEKKTMGSFLAALRRANGMTQKELAERLNVSDKSVSRWERDDGAPDLALIPVIAEVFGVTCDELLRGERAAAGEEQGAQSTPKGEQQKKHLLAASLSRFRSRCCIALALSAAGFLVAMACNSALERALLGFFLGAVFFVAAPLRPCSSMPHSLPYTTRKGRMWTPSAARSSAARSGPTGPRGCSLPARCRCCGRFIRSR